MLNVFQRGARKRNWGCYVHSGSLYFAGRGSATIEENYFNLPNLCLRETCYVGDSQNPHPSPLLGTEHGFGILDSGLRVPVGGIDAVLHCIRGILHMLFHPLRAVREIVGSLGNVTSGLGLRLGIVHQFVGLRAASYHLSPLENCRSCNNDGKNGHDNVSPLNVCHWVVLALGGLCFLCGFASAYVGLYLLDKT